MLIVSLLFFFVLIRLLEEVSAVYQFLKASVFKRYISRVFSNTSRILPSLVHFINFPLKERLAALAISIK